MAIIGDALRQAFMPKHEYERLHEEEKAWGRLQRPLVTVIVAILWTAVIVSTFISVGIVFPGDNGNRPFCHGRERRIEELEANASSYSEPWDFSMTEDEVVGIYWVVVFIPSAIVFSASAIYLVAGIAVAYSAPSRHGCLKVVENNYCASRRELPNHSHSRSQERERQRENSKVQTATKMQESESSPHEDPKPEFDEVPRFEKSLQELRDLRSQLNYAADYCEVAFLKAEKKKMVLESTKEYICKAMITVIDHLGNVSANLECLIDGPDEFSQTELRMDGLQHRLLTCKEYTCEIDLAQVRWNSAFSRYHPRYSSKLIQTTERSNGAMPMRDRTDLFVAESMYQCKDSPNEKVPCIKKTTTHLTPEFEFSPVFNGPSILSKPRTSSFGSQTKDSPRLRFSYLIDDKNKKSVQSSNFISFLRRSKRAK